LIGLPPQVIELVGQIYGAGRAVAAEAVECQFDTSIGLSASFRNHMGALMGEVLSPDRAKIILNSILWAIKLHVHGIQLFGFGEDEEGCIRAIASLAYADDCLSRVLVRWRHENSRGSPCVPHLDRLRASADRAAARVERCPRYPQGLW
jgi:hypothetical protein